MQATETPGCFDNLQNRAHSFAFMSVVFQTNWTNVTFQTVSFAAQTFPGILIPPPPKVIQVHESRLCTQNEDFNVISLSRAEGCNHLSCCVQTSSLHQ